MNTPCIPKHLHRVHTFVLIFQEPRRWHAHISNDFKHSLNSFIRSNNIVDLTLHSIQALPVTILLHFSSLKKLGIVGMSFCDDPLLRCFGNPAQGPKIVECRSVDSQLRPLGKFLECEVFDSKPILDMTNLESMMILVEKAYASLDFVTTLMRSSQKLKSLALTGRFPDVDLEGRLVSNLSKNSMQTLTSLTISPVLDNIYDDPYLHLITELDKMRGQNVLETIFIFVHVEAEPHSRCTTEPSRWTPLDTTFSPRSDFPCLQEVTLRIVIYDFFNCYEEFQAQLEEIGRIAFPWLTANQDLSFKFGVEVARDPSIPTYDMLGFY